jgi:hypothetical protein
MLLGATIAAMNLSIAPLDIYGLGGLRIIRGVAPLMRGFPDGGNTERGHHWAESCSATMTRLHDKALWRRIARYQLQREPLCAWCLREGKVVPARIADHIEPHHNDPHKFRTGALQSLCTHCHKRKKKFVERCDYDITIGPDGLPTDPRHRNS